MSRILVVDDSAHARSEVIASLDPTYEVTEAENGAAALVIARAKHFDLIITDVNMPGMGGIELTRLLRVLPDYASIPIFAVTSESDLEYVRRGKAAGVTAWIVKPLSPQLFRRAVESVLAA